MNNSTDKNPSKACKYADYQLEVEDVPLWLVNDAFTKVYDLLDKPDIQHTSATLVVHLDHLQEAQVQRIENELRKAFTVFQLTKKHG